MPVLLTLCALATHAREPLADGAVQWFDTELVGGRILPARDLERKVVLQYFWATWCPICRSDLPHLQTLYETYRSRGLEIVAQSLDDDEQSVQMFWQERGYTFPVAMRSEETRERFGPIRGTPTLFLVDRGGVIRLKRLGRLADGELESRIIALLER